MLERFLLADFTVDVNFILNSNSLRMTEDRFNPIFYIFLKRERRLMVNSFVLEGVDEELMEIIMTVGVIIFIDSLCHWDQINYYY